MIQSLNHLSQAIYRQYTAVSQSDLKSCFDDPQLYHQWVTGRRQRPESSDAQEWGTGLETFLRTGEIKFVPIPDDCLDKNGNRSGSSKAWKAFKAEHQGKLLLTEREWKDLHADFSEAAQNIQQHDLARELLHSESATWHQRFEFDGPYGLSMKCEMDIFDQDNKRVVDLKTSDSTRERQFVNSIMEYGYDIQAACYLLAAEMWERSEWAYYWVTVRNKPPFGVEVYEASSEMLNVGLSRLLERIEFYLECQASGRWLTPTHGNSIMVYPPKWATSLGV